MGRIKQFKRDDVLDDAIQLFWRQGYKDTSLQDLEKATGVNKSGIYSEFKGKDDLFTAGIKRYTETQAVLELLSREPLGWKNIEDLLLRGSQCKTQKGCWVANCIREYATLPKSARHEIENYLKRVREKTLLNLKAVKTTMDPELACDLILTFNSGLALRLNLGEIPGLEKQVQQFLSSIKDP